MSGKLDAALAWARRGFRVFPLQHNSKLPQDISWTLHATTDEAVIRGWWTDPVLKTERDLNLGMLTTDWIVADVDVKDGKPGLETMGRLGLNFDTLTTRTPSGGYHLIYRGFAEPSGQSPLGPGVDVRAFNGFIVAPGSTIDGVPYVVEIDQPVVDFPEHLRHLLKVPRRRADVIPADVELDTPETVELVTDWLLHDAPVAVEGQNGDDTTYRVACRMRDFGVSETQAVDLFLDVYNNRCEPPWSPEEARLKIENAYRYASGAPGALSPAAVFGHVVPVAPPILANSLGSIELVRLAEKTASDPGAPFTPEVLEALAALKSDDRAAFEALRSQLKKAGCRVTALDDAIAEENGTPSGRGPTQADILIGLAQSAELFHTADGAGFADLDINGHRETWPIRAKGFRRWLARRFFEETGGAPSSEALQSALNVIEAKAHFDAPERQVHIRVGELDGRLYLDLCDESWHAVEIDATGWRIVENPPVRFRRASGMKPMPIPVGGGTIETLRSFLNVQTDADFVLVVAWALACLRNRGPYPVIVLSGEQGSAKSTFSAILRALLDPNTAPLRALPREDRDLFIAASNGHVLAFDNVSGLPAWISDTLCRLATGGGFAVRQLYSDQDEVLFDAARPVILNGIEDIVTRPDLADRAVFLTLEPIPEERRRPEQELWAAFELERPRLLGVLLDAVAKGLAELPRTKLDRLPRMADFALWATACEKALWPSGTFWSAYCGNRDEAVDGVIDADPIAAAVRAVMTTRTEWTGTASELLGALAELAGERVAKAKAWPDSPRALAGRLRRAATFLRKVGIDISFEREGRARTRTIRITTAGKPASPETQGAQPSASSTPAADRPKSNLGNGFAFQGLRTVGNVADGSAASSAQPPARAG